jgi:PAS domain S-box-containing protein
MTTALHRPERLLSLILLCFVLGVVLGGYGYYARQRRAFEKNAGEQLGAIADLKRSQISRWLEECRNDAFWIQDSLPIAEAAIDFLDGSGTAGSGRMLSMMSSWKRHNRYARVLLLDAAGNARLSIPPEQIWIGALARSNAASALRTREILVSDLHLGERSQMPNMDIFVPLRLPETSGAGGVAGILMFEIDPYDFLFPHVQTWPARSLTGETLLVRREGSEVVYLNELRFRNQTALRLRTPLSPQSRLPAARAVLGEEGVVQGADYRGTPVLASLLRIPNTAWCLVAKQDLSEIHAPLSGLFWTVGVVAGLLILAASLGIGYLWRSREYEFARIELEEQKRAEASLRAGEERYRLLFDEMITGFAVHELICDTSGQPCDYRFLQVNPAFEKLTGLRASDITGKRALEVLPGLESAWIERYGSVGLTGEPIQFEDYNRPLDKYYEVRAFRPEAGKFAVLFQDISGRRRAERERERLTAELERKNEELEHIIYAASHDLRSPLVNIEGFSKRLEKSCQTLMSHIAGAPLPEDRRAAVAQLMEAQIPKALGFIRLGVARMNNLIGGLLHLSRLGHAVLRPEILDMNRLIGEVIAAQDYQLRTAQARVDIGPLPPCLGDAVHIGQVFSNLVDNALKYRHASKPIGIALTGHDENGESIYCVADTGIGIAREHQEKIWELFYRLNPDGPAPGEGLGLNLVRRILDRHHGRAWVESVPGRGSRFFVALPSAPGAH